MPETGWMAQGFTILVLGLLGAAALCLFRIAKGPTSADRMAAVDIIGTLVVGFTAVLAGVSGKDYLLSVAIAWALASFVGTLGLAKRLEGRSLDD